MTISARLKYSPGHVMNLNEEQTAVRDQIRAKLESEEYRTEDVPCFCGQSIDITIAEKDRFGLPVHTLLCMNCGLLRTSPRMTAEDTGTFYQTEYRGLYSGNSTPDQLFEKELERGQHIVKLFANLLEKVETVYEVGCGAGGALLPFQEAGKTVAGCDMDDEFLAVGREKGLTLVNGTVEDLIESQGRPADLILLFHVAEHFLDLSKEFESIIGAVAPGGHLLMEVPGISSIPRQYRGDILLYLQNAHTFHFTEATYSYVLQSVGLEVISADEHVTALARLPENREPGLCSVSPPKGEALAVLAMLAEIERKHMLRAGFLTKKVNDNSDQLEPWPLATEASYRVLAWPRFDDLESIARVLRIAMPLLDDDRACLCLRYDGTIDIPRVEVDQQLQRASQLVNLKGHLKILLVDDFIPKADWPRLGRAVTCVIHPDPDPIREEFVRSLEIKIVTGNF